LISGPRISALCQWQKFSTKVGQVSQEQDVHFTPQNGHQTETLGYSLCANSRHSPTTLLTTSLDAPVTAAKLAQPKIRAIILCPFYMRALMVYKAIIFLRRCFFPINQKSILP
jgi:hypothetical protein